MQKLQPEATLADVITRLNDLAEHIGSLQVRDRGPKSSRSMTRLDAWRVIHGDLKEIEHKEAAKMLGLSYGQIYSARGTYTFKDIKKDEYNPADITPIQKQG